MLVTGHQLGRRLRLNSASTLGDKSVNPHDLWNDHHRCLLPELIENNANLPELINIWKFIH